MENDKIAMGAGMFLLVAIGAFLIIPMSQEKTLILTTRDESNPVSCLDGDQLILAQNLTDLCDVVIISPSTNQTLVYNGTYWVNTDQVIFNDTSTCQNIGNGSAFICVEGTNIDFRSILAGSGISVSNSSDTITIVNTLPEATSGSNLGTYGQGVFSSEVGNDLQFKKILAGTSITVTSNSTNVIITNSKPEQGCTSAGGTSIWKTTTTCDAKGLTAGVGLTLTSNTNDNNYKTNFANGTGISITGTTTQTFSSQCNSTGSGEPVCESANNINSLIGADGITIADTTGDLTIYPMKHKLCQTVLDSANATISCNNFTAYKVLEYSVVSRSNGGTGIEPAIRFNGDTGNNYTFRTSTNGAADGTQTSTSRCNLRSNASLMGSTNAEFDLGQIWNTSGERKLIWGQGVNGVNTDAGTSMTRVEMGCKWSNTSAQITSITVISFSGTGNFGTGSEITVWGWDY